MKRIRIIIIMTLSFLTGCSKGSPETQFWIWFEKNQDMLFHFERDEESTFDKLATEMHKVQSSLTFEFGPEDKGKRDFVISADGLKEAFPAVESLYAAAPSLPRWTIIKFRPRRTPMPLTLNDLTIHPRDVEVAVEADGHKAGITVFVRGFEPEREKQFTHVVFLLLDVTIGEYDMETKVGFIEVKPFDAPSQYRRLSLTDLPVMFDEFLKR